MISTQQQGPTSIRDGGKDLGLAGGAVAPLDRAMSGCSFPSLCTAVAAVLILGGCATTRQGPGEVEEARLYDRSGERPDGAPAFSARERAGCAG